MRQLGRFIVLVFALGHAIASADRLMPSRTEQRWIATRPACKSFKWVYGQANIPMAKNPKSINFAGEPRETLFYDPKRRVAYYRDSMDIPSLFSIGKPPASVPSGDLSNIRLKPGITIGTPANTVIALLGRPAVQSGCGMQLFTYATGPRHESVLLTMKHARVIAIDLFWDD